MERWKDREREREGGKKGTGPTRYDFIALYPAAEYRDLILCLILRPRWFCFAGFMAVGIFPSTCSNSHPAARGAAAAIASRN